MIRSNFSIMAVLIATTLFVGCSSGGQVNPLIPDVQQSGTTSGISNHHLWGLWNVNIDAESSVVELTPLRGAVFNANVQQFLSPPYVPVNQLGIEILPGSDLAAGYVECRVSLTHPFLGFEMYKGFDVRGIFMADGSKPSLHDPDIIYGTEETGDAVLLNPDGYTRWWNSPEFTDPMPLLSYKPGRLGTYPDPDATLNPYKYFADDLEEDQAVATMDTSNRGVFTPTTNPNSRIYLLQFPVDGSIPKYNFNYAVDASWDEPDEAYSPEYPLESFGPGAQCQEAYHLVFNDDGTDAWEYEGNSDGTVVLNLEVFDWQGAVSESGVQDEVAAIWIESPIFSAPVDIFPTATVAPGGPTSSVFTVEFNAADLDQLQAGTWQVFGSVESAWPDSYQPQIDGGEMFIYPDGPLAAYFTGSVTISDQPGTLGPIVTSVDPNQGYIDWSYEDISITGEFFQSGATVEFIKNDDPLTVIEPVDTTFVSETELLCDFDFDSFADSSIVAGVYNVVVTNPDLLDGQLTDGFELLDLPCAPNEWGDDFDSYPPGAYPTGWVNFWSGASGYVVNTQSSSSPNSFMQRAYSSWARYDGYPFTAYGKTFVCYEANVMLTDVSRRAIMGFAWKKTPSTTGHCAAIVIGNPGEPDNAQPFTWYHVTAKLDFPNDRWRCWVDDELVRDGPIPVSSGYTFYDFTHFFVGLTNFSGSGLSEGYYDDVYLYWE